ncbi:MAG: hypothetical protein HC822_18915 [Oscillochloris sp.]|nr:hypothetical protein [Oscillochloris sp.]
MTDLPTLDNVILRRLLATVMQPPQPAIWDAPEPALLQAAAASYLLLDHDPPYDAENFVLTTLESLLHEASRSSIHRLVRDTRAVRGRVLWGATIAARATAGQGEQPYVYQEVRRQYDTPENRLLRLLIEQLAAAIPLVPLALRSGGSYIPARVAGDWAPAAPRLRRMEDILIQARFSPRLRHVPLPERVEPAMLLRAETSRNEGMPLPPGSTVAMPTYARRQVGAAPWLLWAAAPCPCPPPLILPPSRGLNWRHDL